LAHQTITFAPLLAGSVHDGTGPKRHLLVAAAAPALAASVADRAAVTSLSGYLARRVDGGGGSYDRLAGLRGARR
jgi:hypothetical protein